MKTRLFLIALLILSGCSRRQIPYVDSATPRDLASFDRVIDSLAAAAQAKPGESDAFNRLGLMHYKKAKWMYEMMKYRVDFQMQRVRGKIEAVTDEATRNFDMAIRLRPTEAEAYKNKAMVRVLKNEWEEDDEVYMRNCRDALKFVSNADSLRPGSSEIWYWKGVVYSRFPVRKGEPEAARCFEKALDLDKGNARAASSLLELTLWTGGMFTARLLDLYACVDRAKPKDPELLRSWGDRYLVAAITAINVYLESIKSIPVLMKPAILLGLGLFVNTSERRTEVSENLVNGGVASANDYVALLETYNREDYRKNRGAPLQRLDRLLTISGYPAVFHPFTVNWIYEESFKPGGTLAWIYLYRGKFAGSPKEARSFFLKAVDLDQGLALAYYLIGVTYYEEKDCDNAIVWLRMVFERRPVDEFAAINAHQLLTVIYLNKSEIAKAIGEYRNSLKLDSSFAVFNIQHTLFGRANRIVFHPDKPIRAVALSPGDDRKIASFMNAWGAWSNEPRLVTPFSYYDWIPNTIRHFNSGQLDFLKTAVDLNPDNEEANVRLAAYYEFSTRQQTALDYTGNFYTITPISRVDEAIKVLQSFLKRHPESRKAHFQLGQYFTQKKSFGKAEEEYKAAARLGSALALDELERMGGEHSK